MSDLDLDALHRLIGESFGGEFRVMKVQRIRPWTVARCHLDDGTTLIAKWLRSNPEGFRVDRRQIATEAAALAAVGEVAPGVGPSLLARDLDHDLLLIEDLAPRRTLHSILSTGLSPAGRAGLHSFAKAMGTLHAATATATATASAHSDGPWDVDARLPIGPRDIAELVAGLEELVPASPELHGDLDRAVDAIREPGPFEAFSNGDSGANNCLVTIDGDDARLIDFEHACRRHALLDAAALHVPGSMWMTIADPLPLGIEDTYRRAAAEGMPAVLDDDLYGFALSAACALRALNKLSRFDKVDGRQPGHHSRPQLVTTIERTVSALDRWSYLAVLQSWLADISGALRVRWPDADVEFPDDYSLREPFDPDH